MKSFLLELIVWFSPFCHGQLKDCFQMDGASASTDFPCDPDAEVGIDVAVWTSSIGLTTSRLAYVVAQIFDVPQACSACQIPRTTGVAS